MKRKRRYHSPSSKTKAALAASWGNKTMRELAEQFDVHPNLIQDLRRKLLRPSGAETILTLPNRQISDQVYEGRVIGRSQHNQTTTYMGRIHLNGCEKIGIHFSVAW